MLNENLLRPRLSLKVHTHKRARVCVCVVVWSGRFGVFDGVETEFSVSVSGSCWEFVELFGLRACV